MASTKSEVSILVTAKDAATKIIKGATDAVTRGARAATQAMQEAAQATQRTASSWARAASAASGLGTAAGAQASNVQNASKQVTSFGRNVERVGRDVQEATAAFKAGKLDVDGYRTAIQFAESELKSFGSTSGRSKTELFALSETQRSLKDAQKTLAAGTVDLKTAFRDLAAEIPFLNRGLTLAKTFFTSLPGILAAAGGGFAIVALKAAQMADRVQQSLVIIRNQLPGVTRDMKELRAVIERASRNDPLGRTQEEVARLGLVLSRNGTPSVEEFERRLNLAIKAANASGESAETLAEGIDLLSDAFKLSGNELEETFAKIVTATNGLVPLPELFQALGRGSAHLEAVGVSAEDAARAIASFADAGIPGREAGTAFIRVIEQIRDIQQGSSEQAKAYGRAAKALGIDLSDAHVRAVGFREVLREVQSRVHGSSDALDQMGFTLKESTAIIRGDFTPGAVAAADAVAKLNEESQGSGETAQASFKQFWAEVSAILVNLGNVVLPPVIALLKSARELLENPLKDTLKDKLLDLVGLLDTITSRPTLEKMFPEVARQRAKALADEAERLKKAHDAIAAPKLSPAATRDEAFDPRAAREAESDKDRAARLAREAARRDEIHAKEKKALDDEINLIQTRISLGRAEESDLQRLAALEESTRQQLENKNLSVERRLELEQRLSTLLETRESLNTQELQAIQARAELNQTTTADVDRLSTIHSELLTKLQNQNLSVGEQLKLYTQMLTVLQLMEKVKLPALGANLGPVLESTRQGATIAEEQAAREAANKPGGGFITGIGGQAGPSPLTEERAKAAESAISGAKKATDEFNQALNNAIAGPIANFFTKLTDGFKNAKDVILSALEAIADAIIGVFSQQAARSISDALFPASRPTLLQGPEGQAALESAKAQSADRVAQEVSVTAAKAEVNAPVAETAPGTLTPGVALEASDTADATANVAAGGEALEKSSIGLAGAVQLLGAAAIALQGLAKGKVGGLLGGIAGFLLGGPTGAMLGSGIGSQLGFADGGVAGFFQGIVTGPGGPRDDRVLARLSNGEGVLTAETTRAIGGRDAIERLNQLGHRAPRFADGGVVSSIFTQAASVVSHDAAEAYLRPMSLRLPRFADGGVAGAATEPGRAEVTLTLPDGVKGDVRSDNDVVRVIVRNRRALRDLFADDN